MAFPNPLTALWQSRQSGIESPGRLVKGSHPASILIVEDERIIALDLRDTLTGLGYVVSGIAKSAGAAMEAVEECRPDLVLMDIHLGRTSLDGIQTAEALRKRYSTPIVFLTSYSDDATITRSQSVEPYGFLVKPFKAQEIRAAVEIALHRHSLEQRLSHEATLLQAIVSANEQIRDTIERDRAVLEAALANIDDGIALLDARDAIVLTNASHAAMFGLDASITTGMALRDFVARASSLAVDADSFRASVDEILLGSSPRADLHFQRSLRRVLRLTSRNVDPRTGIARILVWHDVTAEHDLVQERDRQLMTDALTGIPNRRGAEQAIARELARRQRDGSKLCIALFDVDHFKRINDVHGHTTGDEVLREIARTLASGGRPTDFVARWGGEEFIAIILAGIDGARAFCERLRSSVEALDLYGLGKITVSGGVAEFQVGEDLSDVIARADAWLYTAKADGRNRIRS